MSRQEEAFGGLSDGDTLPFPVRPDTTRSSALTDRFGGRGGGHVKVTDLRHLLVKGDRKGTEALPPQPRVQQPLFLFCCHGDRGPAVGELGTNRTVV